MDKDKKNKIVPLTNKFKKIVLDPENKIMLKYITSVILDLPREDVKEEDIKIEINNETISFIYKDEKEIVINIYDIKV